MPDSLDRWQKCRGHAELAPARWRGLRKMAGRLRGRPRRPCRPGAGRCPACTS